jgi:hypothetical protein
MKTKEELLKHSRAELNEMATALGVVDSEKLPNKDAVIDAILATDDKGGDTPAESKEKPAKSDKKQPEFPLYESKKEVRAIKIGTVERLNGGAAIITPAKKKYNVFKVSAFYMRSFQAMGGGYYLVLSDGKESYMSNEVFKADYEKV